MPRREELESAATHEKKTDTDIGQEVSDKSTVNLREEKQNRKNLLGKLLFAHLETARVNLQQDQPLVSSMFVDFAVGSAKPNLRRDRLKTDTRTLRNCKSV